MGLLRDLFKSSFQKWIENASYEDLAEAYEQARQQWLKKGGGDKTQRMYRLDAEMSKRTAEKWKNDPRRNKDQNFRWTDANRWD